MGKTNYFKVKTMDEISSYAVKAGIAKKVEALNIPEDKKIEIYEKYGLPHNW